MINAGATVHRPRLYAKRELSAALAGLAALGLLLFIWPVRSSAQSPAPAQPPVDLSALLARVVADPLCAQVQIAGICHCGISACGLRVNRYVPVAFVETTSAPGDSLLNAGMLRALLRPGAASTASSALSTTDNTAEAHVWDFPDLSILGLGCVLCMPSSASVPAGVVDPGAAVCGPAAAIAGVIASTAPSIAGPGGAGILPSLAYASELDWINWRTGCRDLISPVNGPIAGALDCAGADAGLAGAWTGDSGCIGRWGAMRPRQMRDIGPAPVLYSAKTAVRAMSIARSQLGTFPFPIDGRGKLQQVYPAISACFAVGSLPLPQLPESPLPVGVSADGRYGWIYWRPTSCCAGLATAQRCLSALPIH